MKKVKVIQKYSDIVLKKIMKEGTVFEVDDKRADHLVKQGMVEVVKQPKKTENEK